MSSSSEYVMRRLIFVISFAIERSISETVEIRSGRSESSFSTFARCRASFCAHIAHRSIVSFGFPITHGVCVWAFCDTLGFLGFLSFSVYSWVWASPSRGFFGHRVIAAHKQVSNYNHNRGAGIPSGCLLRDRIGNVLLFCLTLK